MVTAPRPEGGLTVKPIGLDFTAVMLAGAGRGVDLRMLSELLPRIEVAIMAPPDDAGKEVDDDNA